ncbi:MAG TPA: 4-hydroxy-3-methylbut-2-enyl diphosphate reductase, partial [Candidatus Anoxymicrobiaceae bacterium]
MALDIRIARDSSFCPGVGRALKITEEILFNADGPTYTLGPLIHNPGAVERLAMIGLDALDPDELESADLSGASVIVRSHGIDIQTEKKLEELGAEIIDATCPTVKHAQEAARELADDGYTVVVLGKEAHPEVRSIIGRAGGPVTALANADDARRWVEETGGSPGRVGIVCQTTLSKELLDAVVSILKESAEEVEVKNTLCESVMQRRKEAIDLCGTVDLMIVVGGHNSSNTAQLAATCATTGVATHLIEYSDEIQPEWLEGVES